MKFTRNLNISNTDFYRVLVKNLQHELDSQEELREGITYKKKIKARVGSEVENTVTIKKLDPNKIYSLSFMSPYGEQTITYEIEKLTNTSIKVTYEETYKSDSDWKKYNQIFFEIAYYFPSKIRFNRLLTSIEQHVLTQQEKDLL